LGAGAAYLLSVVPSDEEIDEPVTAGEILGLTSVAALLFRRVDKLRRKIYVESIHPINNPDSE
jgi:hypothetical protein